MITQTYDLNLIPGGQIVNVHVSQYDEGRTIKFNLINGSSPFTPPSGTTALLEGTRPDNNGFSVDATISGGTVSFTTSEDICAIAGDVVCEIRLRNGNVNIGTGNFILNVERAGYANNVVVSRILISTPPTKTSYIDGDLLDTSGMSVKAMWSNGTVTDITGSVTTDPANGAALSTSDASFKVYWVHGGVTYSVDQPIIVSEPATLLGINITTPPTKTSYRSGEVLDLTGIVVNARWSDNTQTDITSSITTSPAEGATLSTSDTRVTISWTYKGTTYTTTQAISVAAPATLMSIYVSTPPSKTTYYDGESLNLSEMVVKARWSDSTETIITNSVTTNPTDGATLSIGTVSVVISYSYGGVSRTTSQPITVSEIPVTPVSIYVATAPTKVSYYAGEYLSLDGMVVKAIWSNSTETDVTSNVTTSPANGAALATSDTEIAISYDYDGETYTASQEITVTQSTAVVYGVSWVPNENNPAWTRIESSESLAEPVAESHETTGSSPFDNIAPWSGMQVVTDPIAGELVSIPKFYYTLGVNDALGLLAIKISSTYFPNSLVSPAHIDRGDGKGERNIVYVGRYNCDSNYKSTSGAAPLLNKTREEMRNGIRSLGAGYHLIDIHTMFTIWMLCLVEYANWDVIVRIGGGYNNSDYPNSGITDGMTYHTGVSDSQYSAQDQYGNRKRWKGSVSQYRHIEGLWDQVRSWVDGCYQNSDGLWIINKPADFGDYHEDARCVGTPTTGYAKKYTVGLADFSSSKFLLFFPSEGGGSNSSYTRNAWGYQANYPTIAFGGNSNIYTPSQLFSTISNGATGKYLDCGGRLIKLP